MTEVEGRQEGLGAGFPGKRAQWLLRLLLPEGRREEFVGDLIEEAGTVVLPRRGRSAALRWFWWQAVTSASPMHVRRCAREVGMHRQRWIMVLAILVLGSIMAFDSGVTLASGGVIGLAVLPVAIPAAAGLLSGNLRIHAISALVSTAVLLGTRLWSGVEMRWYAMPWIFYMLLLMNWHFEHRRITSADQGDESTAS
jgi:hypothetical protein